MIRINIICIGKIKEKYFTDAISEYAKRLTAFCKFAVVELAEEKIRNNNPNEAEISEVIEAEGERILKKIGAGDYAVAMCIEGKQISSDELAQFLADRANSGAGDVAFVIGSSHGLDDSVKRTAQARISLGRITLPHQLARLVLTEQLYRACTINAGMKYHK